MKVYHGSTLVVQYPLAGVGRDNLDFGKGFYVTDIYNQAVRWASVMMLRRPDSSAMVNVYELDVARLSSADYKLLRFEGYNSEWLDFILVADKERNHGLDMI